jgi:hypothetical protein
LVTGALEELERDLLVDDICGRASRGLDLLREKQGRKPARTVFGQQNLERGIASSFRRDPVAGLQGGEEGIAHVLRVCGGFHAIGNAKVEAVLQAYAQSVSYEKSHSASVVRTLRLSCGICGEIRTNGMYRRLSTSRSRSTTES